MKIPSKLLSFAGVAAVTVWLSAQPAPTSPGVLQVGTGFDYSRGHYGFSEDTTVVSVPWTLSYEKNHWAFKTSLPYVWIDGPSDVVLIPGNVGGGSARSTTRSASGVGDLTASASYRFDAVNEVHYSLTTQLKLPTADENRGLGTGKSDVYTQVDAYRAFGDVIPYGTFGYRVLGASARYPLQDGFYASLGTLVRVSTRTSVGAGANWRQPLVKGGDDARELNAFVIHQLNDRWNLQTYVMKGFTNASPDLGCGASVSYRF